MLAKKELRIKEGGLFGFNSELDTKQDSEQGNTQDNAQDIIQNSNNVSKQGSEQYTTQYTNKYTAEIPEKTELYEERLVANVTKKQKEFVKKVAKKFDNESAFVRYMLDYFMENISFK